MRKLTLAGLDVHLAGGSDREGGGDGPLLVLLHGFGAPGTDLVSLWRQIQAPPGLRFAFPEAPIRLPTPGYDGRAWWPLDMEKLQRRLMAGPEQQLALAKEEPPGLEAARQRITDLLGELRTALAVPEHGLVLGGFSQGSMLSIDVALRTPTPLAGLLLMSSAPVALDIWASQVSTRAGLPVLMSHGRQDPVLPFVGGEYLAKLFTDAGLPVTFRPFNGGHTIPDLVVREIGTFVEAAAYAPSVSS
jgi:phospholipase/carboxylesterase